MIIDSDWGARIFFQQKTHLPIKYFPPDAEGCQKKKKKKKKPSPPSAVKTILPDQKHLLDSS